MKFRVQTEEQARAVVGRLMSAIASGPQLVSVAPYKPPKTRSQINKVFAMLDDLAAHVGYGKEEVREWIKEEHGPRVEIQLPNQDPKRVPKSMADYSREEASDLIEVLYKIGADCHVEWSE